MPKKNYVEELSKYIIRSRALFFKDPNTGKKIYGVPVITNDPNVIEIMENNQILASIHLSDIRDVFGGLVWVKLRFASKDNS